MRIAHGSLDVTERDRRLVEPSGTEETERPRRLESADLEPEARPLEYYTVRACRHEPERTGNARRRGGDLRQPVRRVRGRWAKGESAAADRDCGLREKASAAKLP